MWASGRVWIWTDFAPSEEWVALRVRTFAKLFGWDLIQMAPAPPLSVREKGVSPTRTPGPVSSKVTLPPPSSRGAPYLSVTWKATRVASTPSPSMAASSSGRAKWAGLASEEEEQESERWPQT